MVNMTINECFVFFDSFTMFRNEMIEQLLNHQIETCWPVNEQDYRNCELQHHQYKAIIMIMREVVSNVIKHSRASIFLVETSVTNSCLELRLMDNGIGVSPKDLYESKGSGLINIKKIIQEVRGLYKITSSEIGTEVKIFIQL